MKSEELGGNFYLNGLSCGESIAKAFAQKKLIEHDMIKVASALRGGIIGKGELCGCLLTAIIIIGSKYGRTDKTGSLSKMDIKIY